jgi:hypothetical protein
MARRPLHPVVQARAFRRLLRVRSLIAEHDSEQLTLAGMARHAGLADPRTGQLTAAATATA